jgi:hypothetical protein
MRGRVIAEAERANWKLRRKEGDLPERFIDDSHRLMEGLFGGTFKPFFNKAELSLADKHAAQAAKRLAAFARVHARKGKAERRDGSMGSPTDLGGGPSAGRRSAEAVAPLPAVPPLVGLVSLGHTAEACCVNEQEFDKASTNG